MSTIFNIIHGIIDFILRILGIKKQPEKPPVVTDTTIKTSPAPSLEREERQNRFEP